MSDTMWIGVIGTSVIAFALKFTGHSVPERFLSHPLIKRVNLLIPIALLSALVAVQSVTTKNTIVLDHRLAGLGAAIVALAFKASFPIVVLGAAITSAVVYNLF
jgi:branched-subunit amino acid transport protein